MDFWLVLRSLIFSHSLSLQIQRISPRNPCSLIQMNMDFWLVRRWIWNFMTPNYAVRSGIWICPYQWDHRWIWIVLRTPSAKKSVNEQGAKNLRIKRSDWKVRSSSTKKERLKEFENSTNPVVRSIKTGGRIHSTETSSSLPWIPFQDIRRWILTI